MPHVSGVMRLGIPEPGRFRLLHRQIQRHCRLIALLFSQFGIMQAQMSTSTNCEGRFTLVKYVFLLTCSGATPCRCVTPRCKSPRKRLSKQPGSMFSLAGNDRVHANARRRVCACCFPYIELPPGVFRQLWNACSLLLAFACTRPSPAMVAARRMAGFKPICPTSILMCGGLNHSQAQISS